LKRVEKIIRITEIFDKLKMMQVFKNQTEKFLIKGHLTKMLIYIRLITVFCIGTLLTETLFVQCNSGNKNKNIDTIHNIDSTSFKTAPGKDSSSVDQSVSKQDSVSNISFMLPSPDEILSEIFGDKLIFKSELVNPAKNSDKYLNNKNVALNLGIYITDFAYLNLNDSKSEALDYFKIIRAMSQKVNIYGLFNEKIINRLENNLTNKDSLNVISKEVYYNMLSILESSRRNNIYALIASGALIESLYLSTMIVTNYSDYQVVAKKIFEQKYVLTNFYDFASQYSRDPDVKSILVQIDNLKNILKGSGVKTVEKKIKKLKKEKFEIIGGDDIIVTEKSFKYFKDNVIKIRKDIITVSN
jgi:hypothetical protein